MNQKLIIALVDDDRIYQFTTERLLRRLDVDVEFQWYKDGAPLVPASLKSAYVKRIDAYTSLLAIAHLEPEHAGNYSCVATNAVAKFTRSAMLTIRGKWIFLTGENDHSLMHTQHLF